MKSRYLTNVEKEIILTEYGSGKSTKQIAKILGRNPTSIQRYLKSQGYVNLKSEGYKRRIQKYKLNLKPFQDDEFSDYWGGFIAADGCVYQGHGQNRLVINISVKDFNHLSKFDIGYPVKLDSRQGCVIDIPSNNLTTYLKAKYGICSRKTFTLTYPENITHNHFIRGYFDGDGGFSLNQGKYLRAYIIGTYDFLNDLGSKLPCKYTIIPIKDSEMFTLQISQKIDEMKKFVEFLYKDSTIYLERKKELIKYLR